MRCVVLMLALLATVDVQALDEKNDSPKAPKSGVLYGVKETDSLVYKCNRVAKYKIECDFNASMVRKADAHILQKMREKAIDNHRAGRSPGKDECAEASRIEEMIRGDAQAPNGARFQDLSEIERRDLTEMMTAVAEYCTENSESAAENAVDKYLSTKERACSVSADHFSKTFLFTPLGNGGGYWMVSSDEYGECRILDWSRFVLAEDKLGSELEIWNYIRQKTVTNKKGSSGAHGPACSDLDEAEYLYDWRSQTHALGCDYIEFKVFSKGFNR
jgi:hypothetical protein